MAGAIFAFGNECTHVGGRLVEGELQGETVPVASAASIPASLTSRYDEAGCPAAGFTI